MSDAPAAAPAPPEHNVTGQDYGERRHFRYAGPPIIDVHAHVMQTRPEAKEGQPPPDGEVDTLAQARTMLGVASEFGVGRIYSMCPPDDIAPLRTRFGDRLGFNGPISKKSLDAPGGVHEKPALAAARRRPELDGLHP